MWLEGGFHDNSDNWKDNFDNGLEGGFFEDKGVNWTKISTKEPCGLSESFPLANPK